jgi:hypothetical protein
VIHTTSLYYSLSEFYGNLARLDFYFSETSEEKEEFKKSIDNFLIAAYFSLQNDNGIRFSYWLCHAARSYIRLANLDQANEILGISKDIIHKSFKATDNNRYRKAMMSIYYLAESEYILFDYYKHSNIPEKLNKLFVKDSIESFAGAMFGFYIIGFERLMYDAIYNIHRLLTVLENQLSLEDKKDTINNILEVFGNESIYITTNKSESNSDSSKDFIQFVLNIESTLKNEYTKDPEDKECTEDKFVSGIINNIAKMSKEKVKEKWMSWFDSEPNLKNLNHPIYDLVESNKFLGEF